MNGLLMVTKFVLEVLSLYGNGLTGPLPSTVRDLNLVAWNQPVERYDTVGTRPHAFLGPWNTFLSATTN